MFFHERVRQVPKQFSWLDQRLVQGGYIDRLSHPAMGLYLFLLTVGDAHGVSFYSDKTLKRRLSMSQEDLVQARKRLVVEDLIAYQKPFYQVLALVPQESLPRESAQTSASEPSITSKQTAMHSLEKILKQLGKRT